MPVDVHHRTAWLERQPAVKIATLPWCAEQAPPVHRLIGFGLEAPLPALLRPVSGVAISSVIDKGGKFGLRHGRARDAKVLDDDWVGPLFVVKDKLGRRGCPQHISPAGYGRVPGTLRLAWEAGRFARRQVEVPDNPTFGACR